jgi:hypothetical protein
VQEIGGKYARPTAHSAKRSFPALRTKMRFANDIGRIDIIWPQGFSKASPNTPAARATSLRLCAEFEPQRRRFGRLRISPGQYASTITSTFARRVERFDGVMVAVSETAAQHPSAITDFCNEIGPIAEAKN